MGEFGYKPRFRLLDQELTLDPKTIAMMRDIEFQMASHRFLPDLLSPNWHLLLPDFQLIVSSPSSDIFRASPAPPPSMWSFTPGKGPDKPRAGELSDVTKAIYKLPAVQGIVTRAHDEGQRQLRILRSEWDSSPTSDRILMVSMGTIVAAGFITPIVANEKTRDLAFGLIKGRDIPVPGVEGLSFQILDRGGAVKAPLVLPGLTGQARLQFPNSAAPDYKVTVNFDVMEFVRSRSR